jgi:hypothetical protein
MKGPQLKRMTIVIAVCAAIGAIAGIAGSAAAPSSSSSAQKKAAQAQKRAMHKKMRELKRTFRRGARGLRFGGPGFGFGPVHAEAVVPNKDGTGFVTITTDAGTLNSVDGNTVHLKEGIDKKVYKNDVGIDVGSNAKVIRNRADAKLSDLKAGDHVRVITGTPKGNIVIAEDDSFIQQQKKHFREHFGHRAFGPGFGPPGPPPGAPAPPSGSNQNGSYPGGSGDGTNS